MLQHQAEVVARTRGRGLHDVTSDVVAAVTDSGVRSGLCTVFISHTSASLTIQENADPSARRDLERFIERLVPEGDPHFTHTAEGPDDMPSHIKTALTGSDLLLPVSGGRLAVGTWQGVYLCEHRDHGGPRSLVVTLFGE